MEEEKKEQDAKAILIEEIREAVEEMQQFKSGERKGCDAEEFIKDL